MKSLLQVIKAAMGKDKPATKPICIGCHAAVKKLEGGQLIAHCHVCNRQHSRKA